MLSLTAKNLREDLVYVAKTTGIPASAAAVGSMAGVALTRRNHGVKAAIVGTACVGGGALMALQGQGRVIPYAGAGLVFGSLWGLLGR